MSQERTEALVLRGVDFSETSRIVTLLSPERGRLVCMAKGAKRPKSPLAGMMDTFNRLEVIYYWKDGRAVQQLGDTTLLDGFRELKQDLEKSSYGTLALEIALKIARDNEPSEALYSALLGGLVSLKTWAGEARNHACWQMWRLLAAGGFEPGLEACWACGKSVGPAPGFAYAGGVTCERCKGDVKLAPATYEAFRQFGASLFECPPGEAPREAFRLLVRFTSQQLESELRSVRIIEKVLGP